MKWIVAIALLAAAAPAMRRAVGRLLAEKRHDLVHIQLARMAWCVEGTATLPRVIDFVDALSLNF